MEEWIFQRLYEINPTVLGMILGALEFAAFFGFISVAYTGASLLEYAILTERERFQAIAGNRQVSKKIKQHILSNSVGRRITAIIQGCFWILAFHLTYQLVYEMKLGFSTKERTAIFIVFSFIATVVTWDYEKET